MRPVVLDVRWRLAGPPGIDSYRAGHIPGAVFADLDTDLAGPPGGPGGRHPLPDPVRFTDAMRRAGVHAGQLVVAYDDGDATPAARAWWTLRYFGHPQVRVLDGGYRAWMAAGLPVSVAPASPGYGDFTAVPGGMPVLDADGAAALARSGVLLDARAPERYRGETEPVDPVAGHIPGARQRPHRGQPGPPRPVPAARRPGRQVRRAGRGGRRPPGRGVLRLRRHGLRRRARAGRGRRGRGAVPGLLVGLAGRPGPPGRDRPGAGVARGRRSRP